MRLMTKGKIIYQSQGWGGIKILRLTPPDTHTPQTQQAPTWNLMVKRFAEYSDNVVFGDFSLQDGGPRIGKPGAGGWPTLHIVTPETGVEGKPYQKKTEQAMCDELKQERYLQGIIEVS